MITKMLRYDYFSKYFLAYGPPEYLMVVSNGEASTIQSEKIGRYTVQNQSHNNVPVWKKEHILPEEYLFLSDRKHWVIGPNINLSLFGVLSKDRPTPQLPHLSKTWMFWDGLQWMEDNSLKVLAGKIFSITTYYVSSLNSLLKC